MTFMAWIAASVVFLLQLAVLATQQQPAKGAIEGVVQRAGTGEPPLSRLQWRRFAKLHLVDGNIRLYLVQHDRIAAVQPRVGDAERKLDSVDIAIISVVNQRGNAADRRFAITQLTQKQAGLPVEI